MYWDPSNEFFRIPVLGLPLTWYGLLFALGFWIGLQIFIYMAKRVSLDRTREEVVAFSEKLLLFMIVATVIGARLGHILFYEHPMEYFRDPISILKTWEGGLASHGGVFAILIALFLFSRRVEKTWPFWTFWRLLDYIAIPSMLVGAMIRIGNFFNQEILGIPTDKPWAITFGHPADGGLPVPRHPAQLYEAIVYFALFCSLFVLWHKKRDSLIPGRIGGLTLLFSFFLRFCIECVKTEQSVWFYGAGQFLSLPVICGGLYLLLRKEKSCVPLAKGSKRD